MSDAAAAPAKKAAPKKPKVAPAHPPVAEMVTAAITALKDRKGSSLAAIKKYVAGNYKVDMDRIAPFIRRFLKAAVEKGALKQTKGTGAAGSFKLGEQPKPPKKEKVAKKPKAVAKKPKTPKKAAKKPAAKKAVKKTPKKAAKKPKAASAKKAAKPKKTVAKKPKAAAKKSPKKAAAAKPKAKKPAKK